MKKMKKLVCYVLLFMLCLQGTSINLSSPMQSKHPDILCDLDKKPKH